MSVEGDDRAEGAPGSGRGHERLDEIRRAAIEAEFETGRREETVDAARDAIHVRLARMAFGWVLLIGGVAMLALPGPGLVTIGFGLAVLSRDFVWAERTLNRIKHRLPQDDGGDVHPRLIVFSVVMFVLAIGGTFWWYVIR